jgi:dipeptidyl aminopeptidase/acylaminoacyl peptidase
MPPDDEPQVPPADQAVLEAWIAAGATGPAVDASILRALVVPALPPHAGAKPVTAAAEAADGSRLAVGRGRTVDIVDAAGTRLRTIEDLPGTATAVHFSRDGQRLVIAGGIAGLTGVAEIRDAVTGQLVRSFGGHRDLLYDAELSPDELTLATAGYDRSIKLWNVADGALLRSIDVHNGAIFDLAWHPTGQLLASASADETVKLWRTTDGVRLDTLKEPLAEVFAVAFTPDGRHVVAAGRDKRIHLWSVVSLQAPASNPARHSRFAHESPVVAIGLSANGKHLLTSAEDRSLKIWSVPDLVLEHDHARQPDLVSAVVARADGGFTVGRMDGSLETVAVVVDPAARAVSETPIPTPPPDAAAADTADVTAPALAGSPTAATEREPNELPQQAESTSIPVEIKGAVGRPGSRSCWR